MESESGWRFDCNIYDWALPLHVTWGIGYWFIDILCFSFGYVNVPVYVDSATDLWYEADKTNEFK